MTASWFRYKDDGDALTLDLYIQPNASKTEVAGLHDGSLKIKVAAPPTDHQANDKLLEFLRKSFKVGKQQVQLKHGEHARHKVVEISGSDIAPDSLWIPQ